jgi:hypothetical protein
MALTDQDRKEFRSFAGGFIVGYIAAKGFADVQDEELNPGVTKAVKEAKRAMGSGHCASLKWKSKEEKKESRSRTIY